MAGGLTLAQLQAQGAQPLASPAMGGGISGAALAAQGAKPAQTVPPPAPTEGDMLSHISNFTSSLFPGKQIGNALGENLYGLWQLVHGNVKGFQDAADEVGKSFSPMSLGGDAASAVITPASMLVGGPEAAGFKAAATRVAVNAGTGAALGASSAAANKTNIAAGAAEGAGLSAAGSAVGETLSALLNHLPVRLVRGVLPKLEPGNEANVLENTKLGTVKTMLDGSQSAVEGLSDNIKQILASPKYASHVGDGNVAIEKTLGAFPNSEYDAPQIVQSVKDLIPAQSKLVSKIQQGTATLAEKNTVRQALDAATLKRFTDHPQLTAQKAIGAALADNLRHEVQSNAKETQPIFATLSKEIDVRNALSAASKKLDKQANVGLLDILSYLGAGLPAVIGEKAARSPAVSIGTAKALSKTAKALPALSSIGKGIRPTIIKAATSDPTAQQ